jgi:hypothetical protein
MLDGMARIKTPAFKCLDSSQGGIAVWKEGEKIQVSAAPSTKMAGSAA